SASCTHASVSSRTTVHTTATLRRDETSAPLRERRGEQEKNWHRPLASDLSHALLSSPLLLFPSPPLRHRRGGWGVRSSTSSTAASPPQSRGSPPATLRSREDNSPEHCNPRWLDALLWRDEGSPALGHTHRA